MKSDNLTSATGSEVVGNALEKRQAHVGRTEGLFVVLLGILTVIPVALVRFLPVFDYPHWIYQAHVVANFPEYAEWFSFNIAPIPNIGSTLALWPLASWFGAELAGRVLVGVYAFSTVLAFHYLVRGLSNDSGVAYLGPVLAFNYFFFAGFLSFFLGLPLLLFTIAVFVRTENMTYLRWIALVALSVLAYFCHLFIWLPILAYAAVRAVFALLSGDRRSALHHAATQVVPLALLIIYFNWRIPTETLEWTIYRSLPNKLASLIVPILPFTRVDPFPSVLPTLVLNGAFALAMGLTALAAAYRWKRVPALRRSRALLVTGAIIVTTGALLPLEWFGGMGAIDQRLVFIGYVLLLAYAAGFLPRWFKRSAAIVALVVIGLQSVVFLDSDRNLRTIHIALQSRELGSSMYVAALRHPPIYGECDPKIWNAGNGVFPLQWFPIFDIVERDRVNVGTFDTALLGSREDSKPTIGFGQYQTAQERQSLVNAVAQSLPESYDYLVLLGCTKDIRSVSTIWESELGELVNGSAYHALIRLR